MTPTAESPIAEMLKAPVAGPHVGRLISSDSVPVGGFTPGAILSDRYRIIGLLGRGGMGEVYRADDLKLGQSVALKFLPPKLADDPVRRERFFAEVRITRQLSHPNICRVYDIDELDGRHFLSMEYIDGEDLASLLKRIGHLTNEKALDIARQLTAGLMAAHERGVLHRDLKPANIMLDGHGRVRITDFGLAIAQGDETQAAEIAGTPTYMAPEQLAGKGATVRSDIYSLGLVLYEIYTGKKAFTATTLAELREQKETYTPKAPSEIRQGVDPVVERLIHRCMERDPKARPASAAQLALALPGGDPLTAALAAGETPSPEMVAASGSSEGLRPLAAWGFLAIIVVGLIALMMISARISFYRDIPFEKPPQALVVRSQEFLEKIGYTGKPADSAYGFMQNSQFLRSIADSDKTANRWKNLDPKAFLFWYRQSQRPLQPEIRNYAGLVTSKIAPDNPPLQFPGDVLVLLDTEGRLVSFQAAPSKAQSPAETWPTLDWKIFSTEAGIDISHWPPSNARQNPFPSPDTRITWQGPPSKKPGDPVRIEASGFQGKPVRFEVVYPMNPDSKRDDDRIALISWSVFFLLIITGGSFFAHRNLRLGRGDRRSATRMAILIMSLAMLSWIFDGHHNINSWEMDLFRIAAAIALLNGVLFWIMYIAFEPFVRRRWPQVLISWTRLLTGNWRDPLVGRDALVGCAFGVVLPCIVLLGGVLIPYWFGHAEITSPEARSFSIENMAGIRFFLSSVIRMAIISFWYNVGILFLVFFLRSFLRNQKVAVFIMIIIAPLLVGTANPWFFAILMVCIALWLFIIMHFGITAGVFAFFAAVLLMAVPRDVHASSTWLSDYDYVALSIFAGIVIYAFLTSLSGRPMLGVRQFED